MSGAKYAGLRLVFARIDCALKKAKKRKPSKAQKARWLAREYRHKVLKKL